LDSKAYRRTISSVADFFDLGKVTKVECAPDSANANFFIQADNGRFFVKIILEPHTLANKISEVAYIDHLLAHGAPVTPYLLNRDGHHIFMEDGLMATVQNFVSGSLPEITMDSVSQIGSFLGKLSLIQFYDLPQRYGWISPEYIKLNLEKFSRNFNVDSKAAGILRIYNSCRDFERNILPKLPKSIIHSDGHSENVIFENGKLKAFVDWEDATIAPALLDFVSSAAYWCLHDDEKRLRPKLYRAFYKSYTKERHLTKMEIHYLGEAMKYVSVVQTMWRFLHCEGNCLWGLNLCNWKAPVIT
jgi:Ser/Thr protein kinase RdoA (MazF antagonist)